MKTKEQRRAEALKRKVHRAERSAKEQLLKLDAMLGRNKGAKRERTRLKKILEAMR